MLLCLNANTLTLPAVANVDLAAPIVGSQRPTFLFMTASCIRRNNNCGKFMRYSAAVAFNNTAPDVQVRNQRLPRVVPSLSLNPIFVLVCCRSYAQTFLSRFPSRTQKYSWRCGNLSFVCFPRATPPAATAWTETILSGCIPVVRGTTLDCMFQRHEGWG